MQTTFFSFVIPAHNEAKYIERTITALMDLTYPTDRFEVIVVENGSSDDTHAIAQRLATTHHNVRVITSKPGASRARNAGADVTDEQSQWIVFLDADTVIGQTFLEELHSFLSAPQRSRSVIGTTEILPLDNHSRKARWWFKLYDWGHWATHTSYSIQICRTDIAHKIAYDEHLSLAEDLKFIQDARRYGRFFFFPTKTVFTSTRRFDHMGYSQLFFFWIFFGVMPRWIRKRIHYKVVR